MFIKLSTYVVCDNCFGLHVNISQKNFEEIQNLGDSNPGLYPFGHISVVNTHYLIQSKVSTALLNTRVKHKSVAYISRYKVLSVTIN